MFALCDLNKFYANIIRVFMPEYAGRPIIILSNNDGCNICYSPGDLKVDLPIKMGTPVFQIEHLVRRYNIAVFSCNFPLIADISIRVKSILSRFFPRYENYSIDEIFGDMSGFTFEQAEKMCKEMVRVIGKGLGLPISIGLSTSKTLAKVACKFAKKHKGYEGVCVIDNEEKRKKALKLYDIGDVWGIGDKSEKKLHRLKVKNAYDFTQVPVGWVRKNMTVTGERTFRELYGISCLSLEEVAPPKKNIMVSRSFGKMIPDIENIGEALVTYDCMGAAKLRKQKSKAKAIYVFLETNSFRQDLAQYYPEIIIKLPVPTSSSIEISKYVKLALKKIYQKGFLYKKAGVMLMDISPEGSVQMNVFDPMNPEDRQKADLLMRTIDLINERFGINAIYLAAQGDGKNWKIKQEKLCRCYTTRYSDLLIAV